LIGLDWVDKIISIDFFCFFSQERSNSFNTRRRLHVLRIYQFVQVFFHFLSRAILDFHFVKHLEKDCFETFQIPILIDDLMDNTSLENLMSFVSEKIHQVVHFIDECGVFHVLSAPSWQNLFTIQCDESIDVWILCKLNILFSKSHAHFNLVHHRAKHR
jgi:hypothetical protein